VIARLARRDFVDISTEMSFRFRDVHDHLVRVTDDSLVFQDRITGILDAHLSNVSNRLNEVMKVLTIASTLLLPPTMLAGFYGMNVPLPHFPWRRARPVLVAGGDLLDAGGDDAGVLPETAGGSKKTNAETAKTAREKSCSTTSGVSMRWI
jgi:magnesium transporter